MFFAPTIAELATRYASKLPHNHKTAYRARALARSLGHIRANRLTAQAVSEFRDQRLKTSAAQTVHHDVILLRTIIKTARTDWGIKLPRVEEELKQIKLPRIENARERRLQPGELDALLRLAKPRLRLAITVALETGMRRGEMCALTWYMVDLGARLINLPPKITKTRRGRRIPLSRAAVAALQAEVRSGLPVIGMTANALNLAWQRLRRRAARDVPSLHNFHWHDFRHECLSRLAEAGWTAAQMQVVSGHADWRMLQRYVNLRAEDLIEKLDGGQSDKIATDQN